MSLINDALKKAQRERGETPSVSNAPMPGGGSAQTARASTKSAGPNPKFLLLGAGALLGVLVALGTVLWLRPASTPAAATPPTPAIAATREPRTTDSPTSASVPAANSPAPAAETLSTPAPAKLAEPTSVVKIELPAVAATTPTSAPPSTDSTLAPASSAASTPAPAQASPAPVVQSDPPAPSARMVEAIEGFRVTGIRAGAGSDAKVLMNDRVFRLGDTVDHSLGIKLIAATPNSLTFRDSTGATYTRNF